MHRFIRSVGFAGLKNRRDEDWLIQKITREFTTETRFTSPDGEEQVALDVVLGKGLGVTLRGSWREDGSFRQEFYYPWLRGGQTSTMVPCQVERHAEKAGFSGFLEDVKLGFMLIFFVQNGIQYEKRTAGAEIAFQSGGIRLSGLSVNGCVMLPLHKTEEQVEVAKAVAQAKIELIEAAKRGDEEAMETLTIGEYNEAAVIAERVQTEDVYSIIDTSFMPCGVESDHYAVLGTITEARQVKNRWTDETVHVLKVECNDITFDIAINDADLAGVPEPGRRFKGDIWLQGQLEMPHQMPGAGQWPGLDGLLGGMPGGPGNDGLIPPGNGPEPGDPFGWLM